MTTAKSADRAAAAIQRAATDEEVKSDTVVEGIPADKPLMVKLRDKTFRVDDELGAMAMFEWAAASQLAVDDWEGLAAIFAMLQDVVHPDDWQEFRHFARTARPKVQAEDLIKVINDATELIGARPTKRSTGSSAKG